MSKTHKDRLIASTLLAGVASMGVPLAVGGAVVGVATDALAQDYTNANLTGTIVDENGAAIEGASVSVTSDAQGFTRTATTNASGEWRVPQIPQGSYTIVVSREGFATTTSRNVRVQVGAANAYEIAMTGGAGTGDEIVVTATRQVEFSQTTTGTSVNVGELAEREPIARNATALVLLAPTALPADTAFSVASGQSLAPASVSGASGAENAFFINGLNITNFINGIGGATVPFDFYQNVEVKTGGYQAEFGRAIGGVVNAVTKSGSNDFMFALHGNYAPNSLLEDRPNAVVNQYSLYDTETIDYEVEIGGPIIPDRLFFYGLYQFNDIEFTTATTGGTLTRQSVDDPFYGLKLDGYVTDDHHLEFTWFDSTSQTEQQNFAFDPNTNIIAPGVLSEATIRQGGESYVARYTGSFTDWLTLSAAYGRMETDQANITTLAGVPRVQDTRAPATVSAPVDLSPNRTAGRTDPFIAEREFYRADVDVFFDLMGEHHVRFGYDHEDTLMTQQSTRNGGGAGDFTGSGANYFVLTSGVTGVPSLGLGPNQEYISRRVFTSGGGFAGSASAIYLQDSWDVTDRLNFSLGWRRDQFEVANPLGQVFMSFDDEQAIRAGLSFDVFGDRSGKLYGFYGRYYLPLPSNTAFRIAAPAIDFTEFFLPVGDTATFVGGFDPATGLPIGGFGSQIVYAGAGTSLVACPSTVPSLAATGTIACSVRNNGTATPPQSLVARNLQSTFEDEFLIGYEQRLNNDWSAGASLTYRNLGRVSEDALIDQGIVAYCNRNAIAGCAAVYTGQTSYFIINPGEDATVLLPAVGGPLDNQTVTLTEEDLGLPDVRREYIGAVFTLDRAFDGVWGMNLSYTLSRSEGNFEGALKSDVGQVDPGITADFDFLAFLPGQYGLLPNHRAHQLKIRGSYAITEDFLVGGSFRVTSPRHYGCLGATEGYLDGNVADSSYGVPSTGRFCNGVVVQRGSVFETDWLYNVDLSFRYDLPESMFSFGNLTLRADIFNVFNDQGVQQANEGGEIALNTPDPDYQNPTAYQTPRSVRFGFDWQF